MFDGLDDAYALTPLQQGMFYESLKRPESDIYVAYIVIDIRGGVDRDILFRAWEQTVQQHETLRSRFVWEGFDEPLQLVNSSVVLDWSDCLAPADEENGQVKSDDAAVDYWLQYERSKTLSLSAAPPVRWRLLALSKEHSVLIWAVHHLLADDWSTPLVLQTVASHYHQMSHENAQAATVDGTAFRYAGYVDWLSQVDQSIYLEWWRNALHDAPETPMRFEQGRQSQTPLTAEPHHRHRRWLSERESSRIGQHVKLLGVTLSSVVHAAWALVVARYAGTDEAVFGTSVSGRTCPLPNVDQAVGLFLNTVPSRIRITAELSCDEFVTGVQQQLFEQIAHEHVPLADLLKLAPDRERRAFFESVLVVVSHGTELSIAVPDSTLRFDNIRYVTDSEFPLTVLVFPGERLQLQLVGPASAFSQLEKTALSDEFVAVLSDLCTGADLPLATLLDQQTARMAHQYPCQPLATPAHFQRMDRWIENQFLLYADQPAIVDDGRSYSYSQLWRTANRVACGVNAQTRSSSFIGICLGRGFNQIAAIVGVLLSDHGYIPLEPAWPKSRIDSVLSGAGVTCVVCDRNTRVQIACPAVATVLFEELPDPGLQESSIASACDGRLPASPAYMIYTSGSTGKPKGVVISHANLVYATAARIAYYRESPERYLLLSSFSFDSSIAGIFWTLCTGGTLVLPGETQVRDIHQIENQIAECSVTHTLCLPSLYGLLLRFSDTARLSSLRLVIVAGEACPPQLPELHNDCLPQTSLFNEYGPTEATVWASVAGLSLRPDPSVMGVPIGQGIPGTRLEVVDPFGQVCCPGISGELVISSPGVAAGYYLDAVLSQSRFGIATSNVSVDDPVRYYKTGDTAVLGLDEQLYFLGRTDTQFKVRGHRIEAGEIEARVERHPAVYEACCVMQTIAGSDGRLDNDARLVCYFSLNVSKDNNKADCQLLDEQEYGSLMIDVETVSASCIKDELPVYFSVSRFVAVNVLPRSPNGKVDIQGFPISTAEPEPQALPDIVSAEQTSVLNQMCMQLAALLHLPLVRPEDNFFSIGGDSLQAIRYVAACRERGIMLTVPMVATSDSLAELAASVEQQLRAAEHSSGRIAVDSTGKTTLTPIQRWYFSLGLPRKMRWSMAFTVRFDRAFSASAMMVACHTTLAEFPVLGCRFAADTLSDPVIPDYVQDASMIHRVSSALSEHEKLQFLADLQDDFDLDSGTLLRCLIIVDAEGQCCRIGVVVHHLVTDALSNWLFARRLKQHLYAETDSISLPQSVLSYRAYALILNRTLPVKTTENDNIFNVAGRCFTERDCIEHSLLIETLELVAINQYCQRQAIGLHEFLLFHVLSQAEVGGPIRVDVETHGRDILDYMDMNDAFGETVPGSNHSLSASIGWFTSFFPLIHDAGLAGENAQTFRDRFRRCQHECRLLFNQDPIGYFDSLPSSEVLSPDPATPCILYNYLAVNASTAGHGARERFVFEPLLTDNFRDGDSPRSHAMDITVVDAVDGVTILWRIDRKVDVRVQTERWVKRCQSSLTKVSANLAELSPTLHEDVYADSGLDADELDQFLDSLE